MTVFKRLFIRQLPISNFPNFNFLLSIFKQICSSLVLWFEVVPIYETIPFFEFFFKHMNAYFSSSSNQLIKVIQLLIPYFSHHCYLKFIFKGLIKYIDRCDGFIHWGTYSYVTYNIVLHRIRDSLINSIN